MHFGSRREESVDQRRRIGQRPRLRDRLVDRQHAVPKTGPHLRKPSIERFGLLRIAPPFQLDAMTDFREHQDAGRDLLDRSASNPTDDIRVGSVALADFGNDARVEQKFHRSTSRQFRWRGWSKMPAKVSSESSEPKMSKAVFTSGYIKAFASVDRSTAAFSALPRSASANARIKSASFLGA